MSVATDTLPVWTIRAGDSISFPADPAVCPTCRQPLILWRKVTREPIISEDGSKTVTAFLGKAELHCTNDGCATGKVTIGTVLGGTAQAPRRPGTA